MIFSNSFYLPVFLIFLRCYIFCISWNAWFCWFLLSSNVFWSLGANQISLLYLWLKLKPCGCCNTVYCPALTSSLTVQVSQIIIVNDHIITLNWWVYPSTVSTGFTINCANVCVWERLLCACACVCDGLFHHLLIRYHNLLQQNIEICLLVFVSLHHGWANDDVTGMDNPPDVTWQCVCVCLSVF